MDAPRRDDPTANSRDKYSYECWCWIVVRIDLPLATDPCLHVRLGQLM